MGRLHNGSGHSALGEEENDVVLASVTPKAEPRFTVHPFYVFGSAIPGSRGEGPGSDLSNEEGGMGDWVE